MVHAPRSSKVTLRLTIRSEGDPRKVLSIAARKNGDLILVLKPLPMHRPDPCAEHATERITHEKMSIHTSPTDATGNTITKDRWLASGNKKRELYFSRAIKSNNRFAPVMVKRLSYMHPAETEIATEDATSFSLGTVEPRFFTPFFAILVGRKDRLFSTVNAPTNINVAQQRVGDFNLVVLSTFATIPSIPHAYHFTFKSSKFDSDYDKNNPFYDGYDEAGSYIFFYDIVHKLILSYLDVLPPTAEHSKILSGARLFRHGTVTATPESEAYCNSLLIGSTGYIIETMK